MRIQTRSLLANIAIAGSLVIPEKFQLQRFEATSEDLFQFSLRCRISHYGVDSGCLAFGVLTVRCLGATSDETQLFVNTTSTWLNPGRRN